ncbi:MAG: hypothetical protein KAI79_09830 [Bacteroidales bacterium]|nr:hypothetical protein [Bacteroidales bacterium]
MRKEVWKIVSSSIFKYEVINETKDSYELIPINSAFKVKKVDIFENNSDARYALFVKKMNSGSTLQGYKSSKYYNDYVERAKIEDPELLL